MALFLPCIGTHEWPLEGPQLGVGSGQLSLEKQRRSLQLEVILPEWRLSSLAKENSLC